MCGIVGILGSQEDTWIELMNNAQIHRGPDDSGVFRALSGKLTLAMRRLSIIDINDGHQPMIDSATGNVIVFNGEIFNAPQLRKQLERTGSVFQTDHSDTEVLLQLYKKFGPQMLDHINGMFAFVIYNPSKGTLFGARDQTGIKPFFYSCNTGQLVFASELKSILMLPFISRELDRQSIHHYLTLQFVPSPRTIYKDVNKLPAGHSFTYCVKTSTMVIERYWIPPCGDENRNMDVTTDSAASAQLRTHLEAAVKRWSTSDVPVGCSLSGGLDSSAVVGLMAQSSDQPVNTWSLGFEDLDEVFLDERALASEVSKKWGTNHHEIIMRPRDILNDLDSMVVSLDEPYAGGLPSWYVYKAMATEVKVVMTGTGGDELFGNYGKWRGYYGFSAIKRFAQRTKSQGIKEVLKYPNGARYNGYFLENEKKKICGNTDGLFESTPQLIENIWREAKASDPRQAVAYVDLATQLPEEFLMMTDRFSMAWSLEARTPFLDRDLMEYALSLNADLKTNPKNLKIILKNAVGDLVPKNVLRASKRGFVLPIRSWIKGALRPMVELYLGEKFLKDQDIFDRRIYKQYVIPHMNDSADNSWRIWTLLMFQLWWAQSQNILNEETK